MPQFTKNKILYWILIGLPFIILLVWFYLKVFQFQYLNENFVDAIIALQLSRGWLEGRPLLFDTYYGYHWLHHNYYFILLTGLFTKFMGIYGLFIVYLGLLGFLLGQWIRWWRKLQKDGWLNEWYIIIFFTIGPIAYHIFLDVYGWHPEQYFMPLLGLFTLSMAKRQWIWSIFWGLLTLSVKETSIVLICGTLLFTTIVSLILKSPHEKWTRYYFNRNTFSIVAVSGLIFVVGLWWLSHLNGSQPSRLDQAISILLKKGTIAMLFYYTIFFLFFSSFPLIAASILLAPWLLAIPRPWVIYSAFLGGCVTLLCVFYTEGLFYFPEPNMGIRYPARVGSLWAFMMSCYIFLSIRLSEANFKPHPHQREWLLWGGLFQFFVSPMAVTNASSIHGQMFNIKKNFIFIHDNHLGIKPYSDTLSKSLYQLSQRLPAGSEVVCPSEYVSVFQNVYTNEWSDDLRILMRPLLYIYDKKLIKTNKNYIFPKGGYKTIPNSQLLILADSVWYNQVSN